MKYFSNLDKGNQLPVSCELSPYQKECLYSLGVQLSRKYLAEICTTVQNLSGATRGKYNKLFSPSPFTWITLEQLGGHNGVRAAEQFYSHTRERITWL